MTDMFARENEFAREVRDNAVLTGSEKQIAWARDIIQKVAFGITTGLFKTKEFETAKAFTEWVVKNNTSARYWIDIRDKGRRYYENLLEDWEEENA